MTINDFNIIDDLNEKFLNLLQVTELRVNAVWGKISEEEYNLLNDTYKELDNILTQLSAFINVRFPNRTDLVERWNFIDFNPKIASIRIKTDDPYSIESSWLDGMSRLKALLKSKRAEVFITLRTDADTDTEKNISNNVKQTNISGGQVIINESKNIGNQSLSDKAFASPTIQTIKTISKTNGKKKSHGLNCQLG